MDVDYFEKSEFFSLPEAERISALETHCEGVLEDFAYSKPLTKIEIDAKNVEINQALQEIERLKEDRKELNGQIKNQTGIILENNRDVISKFVKVTEKIWLVNDFSTGHLCKINSEGIIIEKTRLKGGVQMNIFNTPKEQQKGVI